MTSTNDSSTIPDQSGRTAIVTGANAGLGFEVAKVLAGKGARVILACRSKPKGEAAANSIREIYPSADLAVSELDISSFQSVRDFAAVILATEPALHLLINNAGIMATPQAHSRDGHEMQFATNHLGHFLLTGLLLPRLMATPASRVIPIASIAARQGKIDFDDLMGEKKYDTWKAYNQSKLANLMFGLELQRRLSLAKSTTTAVVAHPGASTTGLFSTPGGSLVKRVISPLMSIFLFQPAQQGALPILFAATASDAVPGGYYGPANMGEMKGPPAAARVPEAARDQAVAARLWTVSEELTGLRYLSED